MKRPKQSDYEMPSSTNQNFFIADEEAYHDAVEKYVDHIESQLEKERKENAIVLYKANHALTSARNPFTFGHTLWYEWNEDCKCVSTAYYKTKNQKDE